MQASIIEAWVTVCKYNWTERIRSNVITWMEKPMSHGTHFQEYGVQRAESALGVRDDSR